MKVVRVRKLVEERHFRKNEYGQITIRSKMLVIEEVVQGLINKVSERHGYLIPSSEIDALIEVRTIWRPERKGWDVSATFFAPIQQQDLFSKEKK